MANNLFEDEVGPLSAQAINQSANQASRYATQYGNMATDQLQQGLQQGLGYLGTYSTQAQNTISPYVGAGYSALDSYFDALGIARPQGGAQSTANLAKVSTQLSDTQGQLQALQNKHDQAYAKYMSLNNESGFGTKEFKKAEDDFKSALNELNSQKGILQSQITNLSGQQQQLQAQQAPQSAQATQDGMLSSLRATPGYQFALEQGTKAVTNSAAAQGYLNSGRAMMELNQYGTGLADQTYQSYVNNRLQALNSLSGFATKSADISTNQANTGTGAILNTASQTAGNTVNTGTSLSNIKVGQGTALSALYQGLEQQKQAGMLAGQAGQAYNSGLLAGGR